VGKAGAVGKSAVGETAVGGKTPGAGEDPGLPPAVSDEPS
jgi:hypothetical protein